MMHSQDSSRTVRLAAIAVLALTVGVAAAGLTAPTAVTQLHATFVRPATARAALPAVSSLGATRPQGPLSQPQGPMDMDVGHGVAAEGPQAWLEGGAAGPAALSLGLGALFAGSLAVVVALLRSWLPAQGSKPRELEPIAMATFMGQRLPEFKLPDGFPQPPAGLPSRLPDLRGLPFINPFEISELGLLGDWEEAGDNFVKLPPTGVPVRGIINFLGGFFVGRIPHVLYRSLLDKFVANGYAVIATPYALTGFDYRVITDQVVYKMEDGDRYLEMRLMERWNDEMDLTARNLPRFAVGHSCGALLHFLIDLYYPETAALRTGGLALMSYNNRSAVEAIPGLEEFIAPLSSALYSESGPKLPGTGGTLGETIGQTLETARETVRGQLLNAGSLPFVAPVVQKELLPFESQTYPLVGQLGQLLQSISTEERNFTPTTSEINLQAEQKYRPVRTLLVEFESDDIDETPALKTVLEGLAPEAATPLEYKLLDGTHVTALAQDPLGGKLVPEAEAIAQAVSTLSLGLDKQIRESALKDFDSLTATLLAWLDTGAKDFEYKNTIAAEQEKKWVSMWETNPGGEVNPEEPGTVPPADAGDPSYPTF